jgi:alpha-L-fucosidase 2
MMILSKPFFVKWSLIVLLFCGMNTLLFAQKNNNLWYNKPAEKWTDALPIGNGRIGAMIFGDVKIDHLQFNEETLWSGKTKKLQQTRCLSLFANY